MKSFVTIIATLVVAGVVIGAGMYLAAPALMTQIGGMARNYLLTLSAPAGTLTVDSNPSYIAPGDAMPLPAAAALSPEAAADWPSYNRTPSSDRYSPLKQINKTNIAALKVLCTYDVGGFDAFESGLLMVDDALIATTEFDILSLNPANCALNWRTHEDYPRNIKPANRGAAYLDGMLFRGTQDGRVLAYDFRTGERLWATRIADPKLGESVPAAPIAWDGLVFIGNSGGDFKGGKGHMFALDAKTGRIVWEFFLAPKTANDPVLGPEGKTPLDMSTWNNVSDIPISGAGTWTSFTLDVKTGALYVPGGNPAPDFAVDVREGGNLYSDSVVVLDAETGDYRYHYKLVPRDWHDWDASNPPVLVQTMGAKRLLVIAPKDGHLYGFDLDDNNRLLYRVRVTRIENVDEPFVVGKDVHFCPGAVGGGEWNSPSFVPESNLILVGEVEWCDTVRLEDVSRLRAKGLGEPWAGMATLNPFWTLVRERKSDGTWAGWVYAVDADTGVWKWRLKSNYPIVGGVTPTAGGIAFVGDVGGNFYALDTANGQKLWSGQLGGAIGGGVITYATQGVQRVAVAIGFTHVAWPTKIVTPKIVVLGLPE
ncbi:MAG TPA: PQQ-binding-like beta-propeller repeat protein [Steroidobacteraceae bacterium]|nr:PQQ-binding-like beta-propeller repeat protein [Steroidobacteraceae bacterium]